MNTYMGFYKDFERKSLNTYRNENYFDQKSWGKKLAYFMLNPRFLSLTVFYIIKQNTANVPELLLYTTFIKLFYFLSY